MPNAYIIYHQHLPFLQETENFIDKNELSRKTGSPRGMLHNLKQNTLVLTMSDTNKGLNHQHLPVTIKLFRINLPAWSHCSVFLGP